MRGEHPRAEIIGKLHTYRIEVGIRSPGDIAPAAFCTMRLAQGGTPVQVLLETRL
jgi:hypothetical protein